MLGAAQALAQPEADSPVAVCPLAADRAVAVSVVRGLRMSRGQAGWLAEQWGGSSGCSVMRGLSLPVQICRLSRGRAALWYSKEGRDIFTSWRSLCLALDRWVPCLSSSCCHTGVVVAACLPVQGQSDTPEGSSALSPLVPVGCDEPVAPNLCLPNIQLDEFSQCC